MAATREPVSRSASAASQARTASRFGEVRKTLASGNAGSMRHLPRLGERPVGVRYRLDAMRGAHLTTVGIVVDENPLASPARPRAGRQVLVRIAYAEKDLQGAAREAGGVWQRERRVWLLPLSATKALHHDNRIVTENAQI